jgi:pimeloyl-ACP methyl ester carboxylesterase
MPVIAIGGERSFGEMVGNAVRAVAPDVQSVIMPATGHFLAEESPEELLATLTEFLAPYRPGAAAATLATA